ncbi:MAG: oligosaccharide repeat unit polymerase [Prevotella sp.]|nr:oligosaccharide repeat unit polymerase [Prevotella sp.]
MQKTAICKILYIFLVFVSFVIASVINVGRFQMADIHFYLLTAILIIDIIDNKSITLLTVWIVGFVYILLSEMLLVRYSILFDRTYRFIFVANDFVLLGYLLSKTKQPKKVKEEVITVERHRKLFTFLLVLIYLMYVILKTPDTIEAFYRGGRNVVSTKFNVVIAQLLSTYKYYPLLLGFYMVRVLHKSKWTALLVSLPIFWMVLLSGTRFRLLFALVPFLLICGFFRFDKFSMKNLAAMAAFVGLFVIVGPFMVAIRGTSFEKAQKEELFMTETRSGYFNYLSVKVCEHGSPEGCVKMVNYVFQYFDEHDFTYGKSTGFVFYFWIPRFLWHSKPVMLNYWLPRVYMDNLRSNHSTSSAFCGEPYADFGYFSLILMFFFGVGIKKGTNFLRKYRWGLAPNYKSIYAVLLIPYVFFAVRSPVTASMTILAEMVFMYVCHLLFFKKKVR